MELSDYMSPAKFPVTSRPHLSAKEQFRIDAFNYGSLLEWIEQGNPLSERQEQAFAELKQKVPAQAALKSQVI